MPPARDRSGGADRVARARARALIGRRITARAPAHDLGRLGQPLGQGVAEQLKLARLRVAVATQPAGRPGRGRARHRRGPSLCQPRRRRRRGSGGSCRRSRTGRRRGPRPSTAPRAASSGRGPARRPAPRTSAAAPRRRGPAARCGGRGSRGSGAGRRPRPAGPGRRGRTAASGGSGGPGGAGTRGGRGTRRKSGGGPSKIIVEATCMCAPSRSRCRNDVSRPVRRSRLMHTSFHLRKDCDQTHTYMCSPHLPFSGPDRSKSKTDRSIHGASRRAGSGGPTSRTNEPAGANRVVVDP